ncbi:unnamed protein product [Hydatigera taeniaeformis]|uniref:Rad60-SLD domain-containing protein n=1 Tax=Hydatigena taeniaeformis TaxID=6205 RepID=A0A0R3WV33_HYDTA|nr:unnamed protein product [Hydatigera taeniaeformis]
MTSEKKPPTFAFSDEREGARGGSKTAVTRFTKVTPSELQSPSAPRQKRVQFPEDDAQLATILPTAGGEPWCVDPETPNHVIVDSYAESCLRLNCRPLSCIIEQLTKVASPLAKTKIPAIILKGTQLTKKDLEALECVFKYCQMYHLSFENTGLKNEEVLLFTKAPVH